jgi:hypothetical protein
LANFPDNKEEEILDFGLRNGMGFGKIPIESSCDFVKYYL